MSKDITISGVICSVSTPYEEGHTITQAEAAALNQTRSENIRNNLAAKIKKVLDGVEAKEATKPQLEEIGKLVSEYDAEYVFTLASVGGGRRTLDPFERMCHKIARDAIVAQLAKAGRKVKDVDKDALNAIVAETAQKPEVIKLAKKRLKEAEELASITADVEVENADESSPDAEAA